MNPIIISFRDKDKTEPDYQQADEVQSEKV